MPAPDAVAADRDPNRNSRTRLTDIQRMYLSICELVAARPVVYNDRVPTGRAAWALSVYHDSLNDTGARECGAYEALTAGRRFS